MYCAVSGASVATKISWGRERVGTGGQRSKSGNNFISGEPEKNSITTPTSSSSLYSWLNPAPTTWYSTFSSCHNHDLLLLLTHWLFPKDWNNLTTNVFSPPSRYNFHVEPTCYDYKCNSEIWYLSTLWSSWSV